MALVAVFDYRVLLAYVDHVFDDAGCIPRLCVSQIAEL
jgi:hypothetical protein